MILLADEVVASLGFTTPEFVLRHEIAHCNGWPADHRGALPLEEWASDDTPVKATASRFDKFADYVLGKTVAEVAKIVDNLPFSPTPGPFSLAAAGIGLTPESKITGAILSNPATARPLAKAVGIGTDLSDDEWRQAHADAFYASKARQAENAATASQSGTQPRASCATATTGSAHRGPRNHRCCVRGGAQYARAARIGSP